MKTVSGAALFLAITLVSMGCASSRYGANDRDDSSSADTLAVMTKEDVIALAQARVSDDVIISQIKASHSYFQLSTQDIIDLANAGVSDKVIDAMIKTEESPRYAKGRRGYYYYPPYYWYAGYPYWYPWYPSVYLGFRVGYYRPFYRPLYIYRGFHGGRGYGGRR
jgi:hypothetical protein